MRSSSSSGCPATAAACGCADHSRAQIHRDPLSAPAAQLPQLRRRDAGGGERRRTRGADTVRRLQHGIGARDRRLALDPGEPEQLLKRGLRHGLR